MYYEDVKTLPSNLRRLPVLRISIAGLLSRHLPLGNYSNVINPNYVSRLLGRSHALEAALDWRP